MWIKIAHSFKFWLIISLLIPVICYWRWFFTSNIYTWGDWGYHNSEFVVQMFEFPQSWLREFLGVVDIGLPQYITARYFFAVLAHFISMEQVNKLIFFAPSVIVPALGIYLLTYSVTRKPIAGFVGSIVYSFNTYSLIINTGHLTLSISYALGPFIFLLFRGSLLKPSVRYAIGTALMSLICTAYEPRGFYLISLILMLYMGLLIGLKKIPLRRIFLGFTPFILVGLMNSYWTISLPKTLDSYQGIAINRQLIGNESYAPPASLLLFSPWWTGTSRMAWGIVQPIPPYFWLIPIFAFFGYWLSKKNINIIYWSLISLVGIFLVKSNSPPFGFIYSWLYANLPGFNAFRDASKFNYYIVIGFSVLIGQFSSRILALNKLPKYLKFLTISIIVSIFLVNGGLVIQGNMGKLHIPRHIPNDYLILKNFLINQSPFFRVLYVPELSRWSYRDVERRRLGLATLVQYEWINFNDYNKTGLDYSAFEHITNIFSKPFTNELLDYNSVRFVVVPPEDKENEEMFVYPSNTSREQFIEFLDEIKYLRKLDIGTKEMAVYENNNYLQHFSIMPSLPFEVSCPSSTLCNIKLNESTKSATLTFSENFNSGWKIKKAPISWINSIFIPGYFSQQSVSFRTKHGTNSFNINNISRGDVYSVYFAPQAYVELGTGISLITLFSSIIGLWYFQKH